MASPLIPEVRTMRVADLRLPELADLEVPGPGDGGGGGASNAGEELERPAEPETRPGDVWVLGEHRLACGDAFEELLEGRVVDCVVTDPPYAIYGSSTGISADIADDKMVRPFFASLGSALRSVVREFAHVYVCCDWRSWAALWEGFKASGSSPKNMVVWDKGGQGLGSSYANCYELVGFFARLPAQRAMKGSPRSGQRQVHRPNIVRVARVTGGEREHNAAKPVALLEELVGNSTDPGERVLDLFGGSGSTMAACERLGRRSLTMEIDPANCDVAVARWRRLTGKEPRRV